MATSGDGMGTTADAQSNQVGPGSGNTNTKTATTVKTKNDANRNRKKRKGAMTATDHDVSHAHLARESGSIAGMGARSIFTNMYGSRGERLRHTVYQGSLKMPRSVLERMDEDEQKHDHSRQDASDDEAHDAKRLKSEQQ